MSEPDTSETAAPDTSGWQRLDPRSVRVGRLGGFFWTAILALGSMVGLGVAVLIGRLAGVAAWLVTGTALAAVGGAAALSWFMPARRYRFTKYRLDHLGLVIHRGRVFHAEIGVLRSRIQHSEVAQDPIERAFGLATLTMHTAGASESAIALSGLQLEEARRLRTALTGLQDDVV